MNESGGKEEAFFILPQYSYFGEYYLFTQIMCFYQFKALGSDEYREYADE